MRSPDNKNLILIIIAIAIITSVVAFIVVTDQPDIHEATIEELQEINGIGEVLSLRIVSYLKSNKNATIEDLDHIEGIGEVKLELIRKEFD